MSLTLLYSSKFIITCMFLLYYCIFGIGFNQRSVWPESQSGTFNIVSRCFENKNNNYCETKFLKNAICLLITNPFLATLRLGRPGSRVARLWICVIINKWHFYKICFTTIIVFIFKTSGYNVKCDGLWSRSNQSLAHHYS